MMIKTITAKAGEGKSRELISEVLLSKGRILIVSDELSSREIWERLMVSNYDVEKIIISKNIYDILLKDNIETVLVDMPSKNDEIESIITLCRNMFVKKLVYTIQAKANL